jgi:hypothetical protein
VLHERTGLVVEKPFEDSLPPAVARLVSDAELRIAFGKAAHEMVAANFTIDTAVEPYVRFYEQLLHEREISGMPRQNGRFA